jgi:glycerophosphoryl diester phosphodiesterase
MRIIEQYLQSKTGNPVDCEDAIFVNDDYVAVIDGATSKAKTTWDGKKSGKIAVELLISRLQTIAFEASAVELVLALNQAIVDWYNEKGIYTQMQQSPVERCVASIGLYSKAHRELWLVSDCQALIDGKLIENTKFIDTVTSNARALYIEAALREGRKTIMDFQEHDDGRNYIFRLLEKQNIFQNLDNESMFSYSVLDGFFRDQSSIKIIPVPETTKEVVLASDGYPELEPTLEESEAALRVVLTEDPLLYKLHRSTKGLKKGNLSYDDRAYVRFSI